MIILRQEIKNHGPWSFLVNGQIKKIHGHKKIGIINTWKGVTVSYTVTLLKPYNLVKFSNYHLCFFFTNTTGEDQGLTLASITFILFNFSTSA